MDLPGILHDVLGVMAGEGFTQLLLRVSRSNGLLLLCECERREVGMRMSVCECVRREVGVCLCVRREVGNVCGCMYVR